MPTLNHFAPGTRLLLVGTKRGLFVFSSRDRQTWTVERRAIAGYRVYSAALDRSSGRLYAADNGDFFGTFVRYSDDVGETWHEPERGIQFAPEFGRKLINIWTIVPGMFQRTRHRLRGRGPSQPVGHHEQRPDVGDERGPGGAPDA